MKIKTSELTGAALDWAVAEVIKPGDGQRILNNEIDFVQFSNDWAQGGPIIEREEIGTKRRAPCMRGEEWEAMGSITAKGAGYRHAVGPTPLVAAMRCYVASKLGEEVEVPDELV